MHDAHTTAWLAGFGLGGGDLPSFPPCCVVWCNMWPPGRRVDGATCLGMCMKFWRTIQCGWAQSGGDIEAETTGPLLLPSLWTIVTHSQRWLAHHRSGRYPHIIQQHTTWPAAFCTHIPDLIARQKIHTQNQRSANQDVMTGVQHCFCFVCCFFNDAIAAPHPWSLCVVCLHSTIWLMVTKNATEDSRSVNFETYLIQTHRHETSLGGALIH